MASDEGIVVIPLGQPQRGALRDHVDDLPAAIDIPHHPVDLCRGLVRRGDRGRYHLTFGTRDGAADGEADALVVAELAVDADHQHLAEQSFVLLLLCGRRDPPIAAEAEPGDATDIDVRIDDPLECRLFLRRAAVPVDDRDKLLAHALNEACGRFARALSKSGGRRQREPKGDDRKNASMQGHLPLFPSVAGAVVTWLCRHGEPGRDGSGVIGPHAFYLGASVLAIETAECRIRVERGAPYLRKHPEILGTLINQVDAEPCPARYHHPGSLTDIPERITCDIDDPAEGVARVAGPEHRKKQIG